MCYQLVQTSSTHIYTQQCTFLGICLNRIMGEGEIRVVNWDDRFIRPFLTHYRNGEEKSDSTRLGQLSLKRLQKLMGQHPDRSSPTTRPMGDIVLSRRTEGKEEADNDNDNDEKDNDDNDDGGGGSSSSSSSSGGGGGGGGDGGGGSGSGGMEMNVVGQSP